MIKLLTLFVFVSIGSTSHALESVYDSPYLMGLFQKMELSHNEFHFYESLDQMDREHSLHCQEGKAVSVKSILSDYLPQSKSNLVSFALQDLEEILGADYFTCHNIQVKGDVEVVEIAFENDKTQLMLFLEHQL